MENNQVKTLRVSIVIPVYNGGKTIGETLRACLKQDFPRTYEVIVVDDGSNDNSAEIIKSFPVRYIWQENSGPAKARNNGWRAASGDIICFTDSDCIPRNDWIRMLIKGFDDGLVGAVAGGYDIANNRNRLANLIQREINYRHSKFRNYIRAFGSYNVAIRRNVLEKVGGFNESYRAASGEDNDLSYKIIQNGYKIMYQKEAKVAHFHTSKIHKYLKEQYRHGYWRMKLYMDFTEMMRGDDYTGLKDIIEPNLSLLTIFSIPILWYDWAILSFFAFLSINGLIQLITAYRIVGGLWKFEFIYWAYVMFLRAYARGIGMFLGIVKFWFLENLRKNRDCKIV
jgi:glycosyltransferase involved in cell wall biosynthesis